MDTGTLSSSLHLKMRKKPGRMVHTYNPSTERLRQEDPGLEASLIRCTARARLKNKKQLEQLVLCSKTVLVQTGS